MTKNRNLGSLLLKEFLKEIEENPSEFFAVLEKHHLEYSLKEFQKKLKEHFPAPVSYIRTSTVRAIVNDLECPFAKIFRTLLWWFLNSAYLLKILTKKKKRLEYLA